MQREATFQVQTHKKPNKMNLIKKSLVAVALLGSVASSNAAIYYSAELNNGGSPLDTLESWADTSYSNTLTGLFAGIDWSTTDLVKAVIMFGFADKVSYNEGGEYVTATAGSDNAALKLEVAPAGYMQSEEYDLDVNIENDTAYEVEVNGNHPGPGQNYHDTFDYREAELGGQAMDDIKGGELEFEVTVEEGSTYLKTVQVKIETKDKPTSTVPDTGTTLGLLGASLAGLILARRKRA